MTIKIFLFLLILHTIQAKQYERCEFIMELVEKYNFKEENAAKASCIAEKAVFETNQVIYHPYEKPNYGIFQLRAEFWCSETKEDGGICNINCEKLFDDDISDDIECLKKVIPNFENDKWGSPWQITWFDCDEKEIIKNCAKNESDNKIWTSLDDCIKNFPKIKIDENGGEYGGVPALKHEFPHAAAIGWSESNDVKWRCGGSLISEDMVLTASRCTINRERKEPDVVRLGDLNIETDAEDTDAQQFEILSIINHPEYKLRYNDISLIKLKKKVNFTQFVMPACLWMEHVIPDKIPLEACGYGQTEFLGDISPILNKIILSTVETDECQAFHDDDRKLKDGLEDRTHLCAKDKTGKNMDSCEGDSGGPLEMKLNYHETLVPFIVGVTAFGRGCGLNSPGVYTRISSYIDWIKEHEPELEVDPIKCSEKFGKMRHSNKKSFVLSEFEPQKTVLSACDGTTTTATIISDNFLLATSSSLLMPRFSPDRIAFASNSSEIYIENIFYHPNYEEGRPENDLALIKLNSRILWNSKDYPACISKNGENRGILFQPETSKNNNYFRRVSIDSNHTNCHTKENVICLKSDVYHVPKTCDILKGSAVVEKYISNNDFQSLVKGLAIEGRDCTFSTAVDISEHYDWINSVVFGQNADGHN